MEKGNIKHAGISPVSMAHSQYDIIREICHFNRDAQTFAYDFALQLLYVTVNSNHGTDVSDRNVEIFLDFFFFYHIAFY